MFNNNVFIASLGFAVAAENLLEPLESTPWIGPFYRLPGLEVDIFG